MNGSIVEVLGAHVVEVVACLEIHPVLFETAVGAEAHAFSDRIEFVERFVLQVVAEPCAGVASLVCPRHWERHCEFTHRFHLGDSLAWSDESDVFLKRKSWECLHKLEDTAFARLKFAECLEVHEKVDDLLLLGKVGNPDDVFVGSERIFGPFGVVETERDIIAEFRVLEKEFEFGRSG